MEGLKLGRKYTVKISAINSYGEGPWTEPIEIHLLDAPGTPKDLTVMTYQSDSELIDLYWVEPDYFGGSKSLYYTVM